MTPHQPAINDLFRAAWAADLEADALALLDPIPTDGDGTTGLPLQSLRRGQANIASNLAPGASASVGVGGYASETLSRVVETPGGALPRQGATQPSSDSRFGSRGCPSFGLPSGEVATDGREWDPLPPTAAPGSLIGPNGEEALPPLAIIPAFGRKGPAAILFSDGAMPLPALPGRTRPPAEAVACPTRCRLGAILDGAQHTTGGA